MNKAELIEAMVSRTGHSKKATAESLNAFISVVSEALKANDKVQLVGFGTFETRERAAREGRNPRTKEVIKIPATTVPVFKAGKEFKDKVNK